MLNYNCTCYMSVQNLLSEGRTSDTSCHVYGVYATRINVDSPDLTREFI
jgi:hypothetical protein